MLHRRIAVNLPVLSVDEDKVKTGLRNDLRHGRIGKGHTAAQRALSGPHLGKEFFQIVDFHIANIKKIPTFAIHIAG